MSDEAAGSPQTEVRARGPARRRLVRHTLTAAAIDLFLTRGYDETTVDEIAAAASVGRRTFFRYFRSKEDVIFPDHEQRLELINETLAASEQTEPPLRAVCRAVYLVLSAYVDEGEIAVKRYRLTRDNPGLRSREIASAHKYQVAFARYLRERVGEIAGGELWAEVAAAAMVAAHNHVLRRWLRADGRGDVRGWADEALRFIRDTLEPQLEGTQAEDVVVAVLRSGVPLSTVVSRIEDALDTP